VGCVNRKSMGNTNLTCSLCVTAAASGGSGGGSRRTLGCASADAVLMPLTIYQLTIQLSATVIGTLRNISNATIANVLVAVGDQARGDIQVMRPVGPGYVCVQQIQVANPTACSSSAFASFNGSTACCSSCSDMTAGCPAAGQPCACPANTIPAGSSSCGESCMRK
jgi:hypothetical protein